MLISVILKPNKNSFIYLHLLTHLSVVAFSFQTFEFSVSATIFFSCKLGNFGNSKLRHINPKRLSSNGISACARERPPTNQGWTNRWPKSKATSSPRQIDARSWKWQVDGQDSVSRVYNNTTSRVTPTLKMHMGSHIYTQEEEASGTSRELTRLHSYIWLRDLPEWTTPALQLLLCGHKFHQLTHLYLVL